MRRENAPLRLVDPVLWLDREDVVAPPGAARPIGQAGSHVRVLLDVAQHIIEGLKAGRIGVDADLTEKKTIAVRFGPLRNRGQALDANGRGDHARMRAAA